MPSGMLNRGLKTAEGLGRVVIRPRRETPNNRFLCVVACPHEEDYGNIQDNA